MHTVDFVVSASASTVTLQNAAITADEITVHVIGILQHSNFVPSAGGAFTGNVTFGDNIKTIYGTGSDLQIYHDGSDSIIKDAGTGNLRIGADTDIVLGNAALTEVKAAFTSDGAASLYYDNSSKIQTTATGVNVAGSATVTGDLTVDTDTLKVDSSGGHIGIGTASPTTFSGYTTVHHKNASGDAINLIETDGGVISQEIVTDSSSGSVLIGARSNHPLRLTVNDSEKVRIDTSGNVGIGGASGGAKLDVNGSCAFGDGADISGGHVAIKSDGTGTDGAFFIANNDGTALMKVLDNGNVGAGTSSPSVKLHVYDSADHARLSVQCANSNGRHWQFQSRNDGLFWIRDDTAGANRMIFDTAGNIGINDGSPSYKLDITGPGTSDGSTLRLNDVASSANSKHLLITRASAVASVGIAGSQAGDPLWISRSGGYDLIIDLNGNCGIGTTGPSRILHAKASTYPIGSSVIDVEKSGTSANAINNFYMVFRSGGTADGYIYNDGSGNLTVVSASDERLKENIRDADYGLKELTKLRPVTFDWIESGNKDCKGFIAQEVQQILPDSVCELPNSDDNLLGLSTEEFIPLLVKSIQELSAKVTALENAS